MRDYELSREADNDLFDILTYTLEQFGTAQGDRYVSELRATFRMLCEYPDAGTDQSMLQKGLRRYVHRSHAIYYVKGTHSIQVLRVLGPGRDPVREFLAE